jgi:hypothetical protein
MLTEETRSNAFEIKDVDSVNGTVQIIIQKRIIGSLSNQLKDTNNRRKDASVLRKLGYVLAECGDFLYNNKNDVEETDDYATRIERNV